MEDVFFQEGYTESFDGTKIHWEIRKPIPPPSISVKPMEKTDLSTIKSKPALVMCDGVGCNHFIWRYIIEKFQKDYTLVNWYLRGHGKSSPPEDFSHLRIQDSAADLDTVLSATGLTNAVFLGWSMGVQVILEYYRNHPEKVLGLIPISGSYSNPLSNILKINVFKYIYPFMHHRFQTHEQYYQVVAQVIWKIFMTSPLGFYVSRLTGFLGKNCKKQDYDNFLQDYAKIDLRLYLDMVEYMGEHTAEDVLPNIKAPVLIITGDQDNFISSEMSEKLYESIENAELLIIPSTSHTPLIEMPEHINLQIEKFLQKNFA